MNLSDAKKWETPADAQKWQALLVTAGSVTADAYKGQITEFLGRLMCKARWSNGAVATGVAKRALGQAFRGDIAAIYDRLKTKECAASETVARKPFRDLASHVDIVRGN